MTALGIVNYGDISLSQRNAIRGSIQMKMVIYALFPPIVASGQYTLLEKRPPLNVRRCTGRVQQHYELMS